MAKGKYSPTVASWYGQDQNWHRKILEVTEESVYDHEGYDSYGYNSNQLDRAGNYEHDYDSYGNEELYDRVVEGWYGQPIPTPPKAPHPHFHSIIVRYSVPRPDASKPFLDIGTAEDVLNRCGETTVSSARHEFIGKSAGKIVLRVDNRLYAFEPAEIKYFLNHAKNVLAHEALKGWTVAVDTEITPRGWDRIEGDNCDECGNKVADAVSPGHAQSCSLHPDNIIFETEVPFDIINGLGVEVDVIMAKDGPSALAAYAAKSEVPISKFLNMGYTARMQI